MRIVIDATAANSGGQVYLRQLLPRLGMLAEDHEFIVFHAGGLDELSLLAASRAKFQLRRITLPLGREFIGASLMKMIWRAFVLPVHLLRLNPTLFFSNAGTLPRLRRPSLKTIIALHNSMPLREDLIAEERSPLRRWRLTSLRRLMKRALREADGSIVFSLDSKKRLVEKFGQLGHDPSVVHHGIEWSESERGARINALSLSGIRPPYILFVSQFHRYKNVCRLLRAFALFSPQHPAVRLVLAGEATDPVYWHEVEATIDQLALRDRVIHIPGVDREELKALYRNAQVFIHPSLAETCSFPLLEAMAMGTPIAVARASALPEIAGDAALYFDPTDCQDMAAVLMRLSSDESLRDELRRRAIDRATEFSWEMTAKKTLEIFETVGRSSRKQGMQEQEWPPPMDTNLHE